MTAGDIVVLGFDVRTGLDDSAIGWTHERRSRYLIRPEVPHPISVDRDVWPAVAVNPDEGYPLRLWGSVSRILKEFPDIALEGARSPLTIEIGVLPDERFPRYWQDVFFGCLRSSEDTALSLGTEVLGFDVADHYLVSGLSNCEYSIDELEEMRRRWSGTLNPFGLFSQRGDASDFVAACDRLVPEHAPFSVYRINRARFIGMKD